MRVMQLFTVLLLTVCGSVLAEDRPRIMLQTNMGEIVLELDAERAPTSVQNFMGYVNSGFYNDTLFHRVIDGFMVQGGGFTGEFMKKQTKRPIRNEANNGLKNQAYTIAMARTNAPHSATSQFFINTVDNANLDHTAPTGRGWGYAVFGRVVEGFEVVDSIGTVATGSQGPFPRDVPKEPIYIQSASVMSTDVAAEGDAATAAGEAAVTDVSGTTADTAN